MIEQTNRMKRQILENWLAGWALVLLIFSWKGLWVDTRLSDISVYGKGLHTLSSQSSIGKNPPAKKEFSPIQFSSAAITPEEVALLDKVTIKGLRLDKHGRLFLGERQWLRVISYADHEVEVNIEEGKVTEMKILGAQRNVLKTIRLARICDQEGHLINVFYGGLSPRKFSKLDQVTIKSFQLDSRGFLKMAGRQWAQFGSYSDHEIEVDVEEGKVTEVRILGSKGEILETAKFARIYDREGKLKDVFYRVLVPEKFSKLDQVTIKDFYIPPSGNLSMGGQTWINLPSYADHEVGVDVEQGKVTEVRIIGLKRETLKTIKFARIYDKDKEGELKDVFSRSLSPKKFSELDQVTIKKFQLGKNGTLMIGGVHRAFLQGYGKKEVEIDVNEGEVTEVRVLGSKGEILKTAKFARIYDRKGKLQGTFFGRLFPNKFAELDQVTIKDVHLDKGGQLEVGGRHWVQIPDHPNKLVEVDVQQGKVVEVRVLGKKGKIRRIVKFGRIYNQGGQLEDVFYWGISPQDFSSLNNVIIREVQLGKNGDLNLGGKKWMKVPRFSNAYVEAAVDHGQVVGFKLLKDRHGNQIEFPRTGDGFGQSRRRLFFRETVFRDHMVTILEEGGFNPLQAKIIADTVLRLRGDSLKLLQKDGLLTEAINKGIQDLSLNEVQIRDLAHRIQAEIIVFQNEGFDQVIIHQILSTHLLPWVTIERLQRTYRLGKDMTLILEALEHPNVEAWIKRKREVQEKRGTLDVRKHLSRYDPSMMPVLSAKERQELIDRLKGYETVLKELLNRPTAGIFSYQLLRELPNRYFVRVEGQKPLRLRVGQQLILEEKGFRFEVIEIDSKSRIGTLREVTGLGGRLPSQGTLTIGTSDVPLQLQVSQLQTTIANLENSHGRTTGSKVLDRLLGLIELTQSNQTAETATHFFDSRIPYQKISQFESKGDQAQEMAVRLAMNRTEVLYIEGPAAAGKTTVIVEIIRQAVSRGKKVLLVSQMHQAVDNALEEFTSDPNVPVLRLGNDPTNFQYGTEQVWPGNREIGGKRDVMQEFNRRLRRSSGGYVIAASDIGVATDWFFNRHVKSRFSGFDLLIMDEASRETVPGALIPMSYLDDGKVIFVGDVKQLPPFGLLDEEQEYLLQVGISNEMIKNYQESVFEELLKANRGDRVMLSTNYRSHPLLAGLDSQLFYEGDIHRRGWEDFDAETLSLRVIDIADEPNVYYEDRVGTSYQNQRSAELVIKLIQFYHKRRGIPLKAISVVTPYKPQVELIGARLVEIFPESVELPQVTTVDNYLGGQNRAIIFDFVRSNKKRQIGFVKDKRRLNVGLSRPMENLAIVWDSRTFTGEPSPTDKKEDRETRFLFEQLRKYYEYEVQTFFPEPEELDLFEEETAEPELLNGDSEGSEESTIALQEAI